MATGITGVLGGLGLFLLGMAVMTEGLKDLAGDAWRRTLTQFTKSPFTGAMTGAAFTAMIQSSGATTVMAVGFVGAGLLTFPQALGLIFGAERPSTPADGRRRKRRRRMWSGWTESRRKKEARLLAGQGVLNGPFSLAAKAFTGGLPVRLPSRTGLCERGPSASLTHRPDWAAKGCAAARRRVRRAAVI